MRNAHTRVLMIAAVLLVNGGLVTAGQQAPTRPSPDAMAKLMAAETGDTPEVQAMLRGSDPNKRDSVHSRTALMWAIFKNDKAAFDRFMAAKPDVNAVDDGGETALMLAAEFGAKYDTTAMAVALVAKGADVNIRTPTNMTALMHAGNMSAAGVVEAILPKVDPKDLELRNSFGQTALLMATFVGAARVVDMLLDKGADIEGADANGATPLMYAARSHTAGTNDTVAVLVNRKANPNAKDKKGNTVLSEATRSGNTAIADMLKQMGAK